MKKYIALSVLLIVIFFISSTLYDAGVFKSIKNHSQLEDVRTYRNIYGPEDLDVDMEKGLLFISSTDRWKLNAGIENEDGIYLLDLKKDSVPYRLATTLNKEFHPHGISYLHSNNEDYLFVVNHNRNGSTIELFQFLNDTLFHIRSFEDELLVSPNDLIAIDIGSFYVTIDHGSDKGIMHTLEDYLRLPLSYLVYFDGKEYTKVYDGLNYANGVNISPDGNILYLTETTTGKLSVLERNKNTGALNLLFSKNLKTGLDNITIDASGDLWLAAHPKLFDFVAHAKDSTHYSPSQMLKLHPIGNTDLIVSEIYMDDGSEFSGSSTALYYNDQIFIGQVFDDKIIRGSYLEKKK